MVDTKDTLDIILVPTAGEEWLVFPYAIMGRIYPYAPSLSTENASEFVVGNMLIQNEKIPVLDFQFTPRKVVYEGTSHIALVSTITNQSAFRRYAIVTSGEPERLTVKRGDLHKINDGVHRFIAQYVLINGHEDKKIALIDLPLFEAELRMR